MRCRIVEKLQHQRVPFQALLDDAALYPCSPAMDQPHVMQPGGVSLVQVLFDDRRDVARREGMKVDAAFDGDRERVLILHSQGVPGFS